VCPTLHAAQASKLTALLCLVSLWSTEGQTCFRVDGSSTDIRTRFDALSLVLTWNRHGVHIFQDFFHNSLCSSGLLLEDATQADSFDFRRIFLEVSSAYQLVLTKVKTCTG
jgi:hypothetical protein